MAQTLAKACSGDSGATSGVVSRPHFWQWMAMTGRPCAPYPLASLFAPLAQRACNEVAFPLGLDDEVRGLFEPSTPRAVPGDASAGSKSATGDDAPKDTRPGRHGSR